MEKNTTNLETMQNKNGETKKLPNDMMLNK